MNEKQIQTLEEQIAIEKETQSSSKNELEQMAKKLRSTEMEIYKMRQTMSRKTQSSLFRTEVGQNS